VKERAPGVALTLSCEILPEMREFERTSTTVTDAYVMPVMARYLESLERELGRLGVQAPLLVMQSNGGVMTAAAGRWRPVHVIESGPAAGVIATAALARRIGEGNVISIDMGGTSSIRRPTAAGCRASARSRSAGAMSSAMSSPAPAAGATRSSAIPSVS